MDDENDKVTVLPVTFQKPREDTPERTLKRVLTPKCTHWNVTYLVDDSKTQVECSKCGEKLNPMWVLGQLATKESGYLATIKKAQQAMDEMQTKTRTKCEHCNRFTRVNLKSLKR